jgi:hypothetical protein
MTFYRVAFCVCLVNAWTMINEPHTAIPWLVAAIAFLNWDFDQRSGK